MPNWSGRTKSVEEQSTPELWFGVALSSVFASLWTAAVVGVGVFAVVNWWVQWLALAFAAGFGALAILFAYLLWSATWIEVVELRTRRRRRRGV